MWVNLISHWLYKKYLIWRKNKQIRIKIQINLTVKKSVTGLKQYEVLLILKRKFKTLYLNFVKYIF